MKARVFLWLALILSPAVSHAGGPILVDTETNGTAVLWKDGVVRIDLETGTGGTLGTLNNADALALVRELFQDWQDVTIDGLPTVQLTLDERDDLGPVDLSNLDAHFTYCPASQSCPSENPPFVVGSARTGESPVLFDDDGSMTDAVQGSGASRSILGFAGPRVVERTDGILYITEGQAILNGRFINGVSTSTDPEVSIEKYKGAIFHELGHFIGLDHTQVNIGSVIKYLQGDDSEKSAIPTMLPLFIDGIEQFTPHYDDIVALSALYPSRNFTDHFCRLEGKTFRSDGTTELQGVNVIAANQSNPLLEDASFVSGSYYTGVSSSCDAAFGGFSILGLRRGVQYVLSVEPISQAFTGGSSLEPCDPPQRGFVSQVIPGVFSCSNGGEVITTGTEASTTVVTTKSSQTTGGGGTGGSGGGNGTSSDSSGGCSLVRDGD